MNENVQLTPFNRNNVNTDVLRYDGFVREQIKRGMVGYLETQLDAQGITDDGFHWISVIVNAIYSSSNDEDGGKYHPSFYREKVLGMYQYVYDNCDSEEMNWQRVGYLLGRYLLTLDNGDRNDTYRQFTNPLWNHLWERMLTNGSWTNRGGVVDTD